MHGSFGPKPLVRMIGPGSRFMFKNPQVVFRALKKREESRWVVINEQTLWRDTMDVGALWDEEQFTAIEPAIVQLGDRFRLLGSERTVMVYRKVDHIEWEVMIESSGVADRALTNMLLDLSTWEALPILRVGRTDAKVTLIDHEELEYQKFRREHGTLTEDRHQAAIMASLRAPLPVLGRGR